MAIPFWSLPPSSSPEHEKIISALMRDPLLLELHHRIVAKLPTDTPPESRREYLLWAVHELIKHWAFLPWTPSLLIKDLMGERLTEQELWSVQNEAGVLANAYLISIYDHEPEGVSLDQEQDPTRDKLISDWHIKLVDGKYHITESGKQFLETFDLIDEEWTVTPRGHILHLRGTQILPLN
jgi:hypothetical protein